MTNGCSNVSCVGVPYVNASVCVCPCWLSSRVKTPPVSSPSAQERAPPATLPQSALFQAEAKRTRHPANSAGPSHCSPERIRCRFLSLFVHYNIAPHTMGTFTSTAGFTRCFFSNLASSAFSLTPSLLLRPAGHSSRNRKYPSSFPELTSPSVSPAFIQSLISHSSVNLDFPATLINND